MIGKLIANDRERKGLTLKEYSKKIGISLSYLSDIEKGRRLQLPNLDSINNVLKLTDYEVVIRIIEKE